MNLKNGMQFWAVIKRPPQIVNHFIFFAGMNVSWVNNNNNPLTKASLCALCKKREKKRLIKGYDSN